uniref:NARG2_C domain-containing protein n=1 Tax=Globodera pallida TaxID=36090 RepID=A0A183BJT9_GLOPA
MHKKCEEIKAQAIHALKALQDYGEQKSRKMLFPETDAAVFLAVKYKKVPLARGTSLRKFIALPYSDRNPLNTSICLILPDRNRSAAAAKDPDVDGQAREWAELLRDKYALTGKHIAKIFTLTQLKREYGRQADKAKLANTYDIFMVDRKLMKMALFFLGSSFKKATKMPLPIDSSVDMSKKLNESFSLVQLHLAPLKDAVTLRIGNLGQPLNELESNFNAIIEAIFTHFPGGSLNIRSCHLQTAATKVSLPIFVDFGPANEVRLEMPKKQQLAVEVDGCSTLPDGLMVKVRADGKVIVVEEKTGDEVLYPTVPIRFKTVFVRLASMDHQQLVGPFSFSTPSTSSASLLLCSNNPLLSPPPSSSSSSSSSASLLFPPPPTSSPSHQQHSVLLTSLVALLLDGFHALPIRLKILLDRMFDSLPASDRDALLSRFGWSSADFARGYKSNPPTHNHWLYVPVHTELRVLSFVGSALPHLAPLAHSLRQSVLHSLFSFALGGELLVNSNNVSQQPTKEGEEGAAGTERDGDGGTDKGRGLSDTEMADDDLSTVVNSNGRVAEEAIVHRMEGEEGHWGRMVVGESGDDDILLLDTALYQQQQLQQEGQGGRGQGRSRGREEARSVSNLSEDLL